MGGTGVIDHFLEVFTRYIDSGFGLLGGEVAFVATTLIAIDVTLAALFWNWGADDDILARLVKKTLFVGVFAYLIGNWNNLARIVFESFAGLGLKAGGSWKANKARGEEVHQATVVLIDPATGRPRAFMDGNHITTIRTGAGGAVACDLFATPGAHVLAVLALAQGGGKPRTFWLQVYDEQGAERFRRELPSDPATSGEDWLAGVTRNKNLALSEAQNKVAVGGPGWLGVWDLESGARLDVR